MISKTTRHRIRLIVQSCTVHTVGTSYRKQSIACRDANFDKSRRFENHISDFFSECFIEWYFTSPVYARFHCPTEIGSANFFRCVSCDALECLILWEFSTCDFHQSAFSGLNTVSTRTVIRRTFDVDNASDGNAVELNINGNMNIASFDEKLKSDRLKLRSWMHNTKTRATQSWKTDLRFYHASIWVERDQNIAQFPFITMRLNARMQSCVHAHYPIAHSFSQNQNTELLLYCASSSKEEYVIKRLVCLLLQCSGSHRNNVSISLKYGKTNEIKWILLFRHVSHCPDGLTIIENKNMIKISLSWTVLGFLLLCLFRNSYA